MDLDSRLWKIWVFVIYTAVVIVSGIYSTYVYLKTHYESELSDKWMLILSLGVGGILLVASPVIRGFIKTQLLFTVIFTLSMMADETWTYWASLGGAILVYLVSYWLKRSMLVGFIAFSAVTSYWVVMGSRWLESQGGLIDLYPSEEWEWIVVGVAALFRMLYVGYMETRYWGTLPPWSVTPSDDQPAYELIAIITD